MAEKGLTQNRYRIFFFGTLVLFSLLVLNTDTTYSETRHIVLATDNYPPHYGSDLNNGGYFTEITKGAFRISGYTCDVKFIPWNRAKEMAKKGHYHGIMGMFYTEKRVQFFDYSKPVSASTTGFFVKKERTITYTDLKDLKPYKIGHVMGYHYTEEFNSASYLKKVDSYNTETNIKLLMKDKIDIVLAAKSVVTHLMKNTFHENPDMLKMLNPPLVKHDMYISISKKKPHYHQIIVAFNTGLNDLKNDGRFDAIMKKHGF